METDINKPFRDMTMAEYRTAMQELLIELRSHISRAMESVDGSAFMEMYKWLMSVDVNYHPDDTPTLSEWRTTIRSLIIEHRQRYEEEIIDQLDNSNG